MGKIDSPFNQIESILSQIPSIPIFLDFHAEATSEKAALAWHLDGRITALVGTHTHVATLDNKILPNGTAFVSDLGMVGAKDSILGMDKDASIARFFNGDRRKMKPVEEGNMIFNSVAIEYDKTATTASKTYRIDQEIYI